MSQKPKIAVFASGNGSNFEAIVRACRDGAVDAEVVLCFCDKPGAGVIERAARLGIPVLEANKGDFRNKDLFESFLADHLSRLGIDIICLAGYMRIVGQNLLRAFPRRIINIHPSLLPAFKGAHAIRDAFDYGVKVYGVTVHYVDETLDGGEIIAQEAFPYEGNDIDELETMIHRVEHVLYPEAVRRVLSDIR